MTTAEAIRMDLHGGGKVLHPVAETIRANASAIIGVWCCLRGQVGATIRRGNKWWLEVSCTLQSQSNHGDNSPLVIVDSADKEDCQ